MKEFSYVITDPEGIQFASSITIKKGSKTADAKRIFGVMGLIAKKDETIQIIADGTDEAEAISALEAFVKENL
ncbi:MAG: galactitol transporter subunit [Caproiciproducens sp.]|nr:galactitol transporter subunit [Caproiciproducens sp.]